MRVLYKENAVALAELFALELKFTIDTLVNWFNSTIKTKFLELDNFQKQAFMEKNPLDLAKTTCSICGFSFVFLLTKVMNKQNLTTWFDFIVQQEYLFLKNIGVDKESETLESFYESFEYFLEILTLLKNENFKLQEMEQEKLREFLENCCADCEDDQEMRESINEFKIVKKRQTGGAEYKDKTFYKTIGFVYERIMNFGSNENIKGAIISENFLSNVDNLIH